MDRQQLEKLFDENFNMVFSQIVMKNKRGTYIKSNLDDIKDFIFDTVIPEVIKSVFPKNEPHIGVSLEDCIIDDAKKRAKDLYGITL